MRARRLRILEIATVCAVLGILVSLAVPTVMRMQARSRVDHLLASARSCREEPPLWLSDTLSSHPSASDAADQGRTEAETARDLLENDARIYNERLQQKSLPGEKPVLGVEPSGTPPVYCGRDGRTRLIPFAGPAPESVGAAVVVTDENRGGGPACDGILSVYNVEPGTE